MIVETSWKKAKLSDKLMTFFSTSFKMKKLLMLTDPIFNETHLQSPDFIDDDIDTETKNENIKFIELFFLYQIVYYILHAGKRKTRPHMNTAHTIYGKCKSNWLITTFNHIEVCVRYMQVQKAKSHLAQYTMIQFEKSIFSIPSLFPKDMSTVVTLGNFDHQHRSSSFGMNNNHDTASALFQVIPNHTPSNPLRSSVSLKTVSGSVSLVLPC